jgi:hypothetical protein
MYKKSDAMSNIFPRKKDVASGMHVPSGENMWAYPADDDILDDEQDKILKSAVGLTSFPGEQQKDYQFEQPMHIKDPNNIGIIDVDTVVDLPPINYCGDNKMRKDRLDNIVKLLINNNVKKVTASVEISREQYEADLEQLSGIAKDVSRNGDAFLLAPSLKAYHSAEQVAYIKEKILQRFFIIVRMFNNLDNKKIIAISQVMGKLLADMEVSWLKAPKIDSLKNLIASIRQADLLLRKYNGASLGSDTATLAPTRSPGRPILPAGTITYPGSNQDDWENYASTSPQHEQVKYFWELASNKMPDYDKSYISFVKWYNKTRPPGKQMFPIEVLRILDDILKSNAGGDAIVDSSPRAQDTIPQNYVSVDNVVTSLKRLINGMPLLRDDGTGTPTRIDSSKASRMTKRYLRQIKDISPDPQNVNSVVQYAATDIVNRILSNPSYINKINELKADQDKLRQYFDFYVWQELRNLYAERGSLRGGKDRSDARENARRERMSRQLQRQTRT